MFVCLFPCPCPPHPWASQGHLQLVHGADRQRRVPPQSQRHLVAGGTLRSGAVETSEGADHDVFFNVLNG